MQLQTINKPIIKVSNLSYNYESQKILDGIDFEINEGEFVAILGPNGGGKSTLLKLMLNINQLSDGEILIYGKKHLSKLHHIGYVPQNTNINTNFPISVLEVIMMGQNQFKKRVFGYGKDEKKQAYELLEKVDMAQFAHHSIAELSGGQRQRVFIARALFTKPKILFLDEPTSSIDVDGTKQIYQTLEYLNEHMTIIVVTHDISVVVKYATRALYINKTLFNHDLQGMKKSFLNNSAHICEVELLEMLGRCQC